MTFSLYFFLYLFKLLLIFLLVFHILKISVKYVPNVHERNLRFHQNTLPCFLHTLTEQKVVSICMNVCCKFYGSLKICGCWFCVKTIATNGNKYTNIFECHSEINFLGKFYCVLFVPFSRYIHCHLHVKHLDESIESNMYFQLSKID